MEVSSKREAISGMPPQALSQLAESTWRVASHTHSTMSMSSDQLFVLTQLAPMLKLCTQPRAIGVESDLAR